MDLQLFGSKKQTQTNTSTYTPSEYELQLQKLQSQFGQQIMPNATWLNDLARNLMQGSFGTQQVDYSKLNDNAQQQIQQVQQGLGNLSQGKLPQAYQDNMAASVQSGVNKSVGTLLNNLGQNGVLNSSVTSGAMNDISKNVSDTMAQQYQNNLGIMSGLYGQQLGAANTGAMTAAQNQQASMQPALNLWNASLGLNGANTSALAAASGKGTTKNTQTVSGGGGGLGGFLGGLAGSFIPKPY